MNLIESTILRIYKTTTATRLTADYGDIAIKGVHDEFHPNENRF